MPLFVSLLTVSMGHRQGEIKACATGLGQRGAGVLGQCRSECDDALRPLLIAQFGLSKFVHGLVDVIRKAPHARLLGERVALGVLDRLQRPNIPQEPVKEKMCPSQLS